MADALETESREALIFGLSGTDGEESFAELVWHKVYENAGKTYVLAMNAGDTEKTVRIRTAANWMVLLYGETAVLSDGYLEITLPPHTVSFLKETDGTAPGLYRGQIQVVQGTEGSCTLRNASYAAVYTGEGRALELVQIYTAGQTVRIEEKQEVRIFLWDEPLSPIRKRYDVTPKG
ncbi:MAG: hypothetical protein E7390_05960 [Ruminococcaceae bacterium]|nr:hypothetical protein [Oscillospiraceae bacterium]